MPLPFGALLSTGASLLGGFLSSRAREQGANQAIRASAPLNTQGPFGSLLFEGGGIQGRLNPQLRQILGQTQQGALSRFQRLNAFDRPQVEAQALSRFRELSRKPEETALVRTRSNLFGRGRLGAGAGANNANPELAALFEAQARADLHRQQAAIQEADVRENALLQQALALSGESQNLSTLPIRAGQLGVQGRTPAGIAGLAAGAGFGRAEQYGSFFDALASGIGSGDFNFGGGSPVVHSVPAMGRFFGG